VNETLQSPSPTKVTVHGEPPELIVQTDVVVLSALTASPELAVAVRVAVEPSTPSSPVQVASPEALIVCAEALTVTLRVTFVAAP
jgi:hypothetical protein